MSGDLSGFSLFELFQSEAITHSQALSDGILAIEDHPDDTERLEQLMRAAHSLKGAARIIDLDAVVEIAHAMEDVFVGAQRGEHVLSAGRVDQLLRGVDIFLELSKIGEPELSNWLDSQSPRCLALAEQLRQELDVTEPPTAGDASAGSHDEGGATGEMTGDSSSITGARETADDEREPEIPSTTPQRDVSVSDASLSRIMQLAGESIVDAGRWQTSLSSLDRLRDLHRTMTEDLAQLPDREDSSEAIDKLLQLNGRIEEGLAEHCNQVEATAWNAERTASALYQESLASRMRPFSEGTAGLPRMVRDLARSLQKQVTLKIEGQSVSVDRDILSSLNAPLNHLLRNCIDHGLEPPEQRRSAGKPETGQITVTARHHAGMLTIEIRDDGRGIDLNRLRSMIVERRLASPELAAQLDNQEVLEFLFLPGFSTAGEVTEVSGRGVGLDVVQSMVQEVSGSVHVQTTAGRGSTFTLRLPITLSVIRAVLAEVSGQPFAFPLVRLNRIVRLPCDECQTVQGRQQITIGGHAIGLLAASDLLDLPAEPSSGAVLSILVIGHEPRACGIVVDRFIGEQDLAVRQLDSRLGKVPHILAAAISRSGVPLLIVDVDDMLGRIERDLGTSRVKGLERAARSRQRKTQRILVVDDSVTVREVERQLLEARGFEVDVAVDGQDGWISLCAGHYDLLVTDIDMPRMNGLALIRAARADARFERLPIVVVSYKAREQDKKLGSEAGADAYLTKGSFHDDSLLDTVTRLLENGPTCKNVE